jgi:hypothetical protein
MERVTAQRPCPVCKKRDWCLITHDGTAAICQRVEQGSVKRCGDAGWLHVLDPTAGAGDRHSTHGNGKHKPAPAKDWPAIARQYADKFDAEARAALAAALQLPPGVLDALPSIGWNSDDKWGPCWTIPEFGAGEKVVGIGRRYVRSICTGPYEGKDKLALGNRGLIVPSGWRDRPGPVHVPEGPSDTLALTAAGLAAVGRPSNTGGVDLLAALLKDLPADHEILITGENDARPSKTRPGEIEWPGRDGARQTAEALTARLGRPVMWAMPPAEYKDVRQWACDLAAGAAEAVDWLAIGYQVAEYLLANAVPTKPAPVAQLKLHDADEPGPDEPQTGCQIIADYFRRRYTPRFRRGNAVHGADGRDVPMQEACAVPDSGLIARLAEASDAPRFASASGGGVKHQSLPSFFKTWARVAWGDLLAALPDEDHAELAGDEPAPEQFRQLVREALLSEVVLGEQIGDDGPTLTQRRSLIGWCQLFAKTGPWRDVRGKRCWCKYQERPGGELVLMVAIRHELFSQVHADKRLREMGPKKFTLRAARYDMGRSHRDERPHGFSAVVLDEAFVADLLADLPGDEDLVGPTACADGARDDQEAEG